MQINRRDIGYTIYSRIETSLRELTQFRLLNLFGSNWQSQIPPGVLKKVIDKIAPTSVNDIDDPMDLLEETDLPDLMEIALYRNSKDVFHDFFPGKLIEKEKLQEIFTKLYPIRNQIAHIKETFSAIDLDLLIEIGENLVPLLDNFSKELANVLTCIKTNPEKVVVQMPSEFIIFEERAKFGYINNLPTPDYDPDGGFIGRRDDLEKIEQLIFSDLYRVVTIAGAGGVGKTALALNFCQNILKRKNIPFSAVVWVSAKEEKLSLTGIEPIEPSFRSYEEFIDTILETFGWTENISSNIAKKEENVEIILRAGEKGILMVVDNLETIRDERIIEYIKRFPPPSKILITSRSGLGEVERRYALKEMSTKDAINLLRTVAREKEALTLSKLPDKILSIYAEKMFRYPLAIKWVVGQVALGQDIESSIGDLTSFKSDVTKFCFEHIFKSLLTDNARISLFALALYEKPLTKGVLSHLTDLTISDIDQTLKDLTIASLIIPKQIQSSDSTIETTYELLPLTRSYLQSKLQESPEIRRKIEARTEAVHNLIDEADKAGHQYRYSLRDMGAETEEEKIAATWAFTAQQKYQSGDYEGAIRSFERAIQIAPNFSAIYRNWAIVESDAGYVERADELMHKAASLNQNDSRIWFVWGNMEKRRNRYDKAFNYLSKALEISKNDPHVMGALAEVEKRRNNFEKADELLRAALTSNSVAALQRRTHEVICFTSLADNLKRWAEALGKNKFADEEVMAKLTEAYNFAMKAVNLVPKDETAQDTLREVTLDFACALKRIKNYETAKPYFTAVIANSSNRVKVNKDKVVAYYNLAWGSIDQGERQEAKKYYELGRKCLFAGSPYHEKFRALGSAIENKTYIGTLYNVIEGKGYGFVEIAEQPGQSGFLHYSKIIPEVTIDEFAHLKGRKFNITLGEATGKSPTISTARVI